MKLTLIMFYLTEYIKILFQLKNYQYTVIVRYFAVCPPPPKRIFGSQGAFYVYSTGPLRQGLSFKCPVAPCGCSVAAQVWPAILWPWPCYPVFQFLPLPPPQLGRGIAMSPSAEADHLQEAWLHAFLPRSLFQELQEVSQPGCNPCPLCIGIL